MLTLQLAAAIKVLTVASAYLSKEFLESAIVSLIAAIALSFIDLSTSVSFKRFSNLGM
jgi:hypothetical protein